MRIILIAWRKRLRVGEGEEEGEEEREREHYVVQNPFGGQIVLRECTDNIVIRRVCISACVPLELVGS